jgi:hypothetical protein
VFLLDREEWLRNVEVDEVPLGKASQCDDRQLVRRILDGDQDAYRHVVMRYASRLLAYLTYILGEHEAVRKRVARGLVALRTAYRALDAMDVEAHQGSTAASGDARRGR